jgi:hypothetical protein
MTAEILHVEGAVFSGAFTENDGPHWFAGLRYKCPVCGKGHRTKVGGRGDVPKTFKTRCKVTGRPVVVVPWKH